jgi:hypothetical protein
VWPNEAEAEKTQNVWCAFHVSAPKHEGKVKPNTSKPLN